MEKGKWKGLEQGKVYPVSQLTDFIENAIDNMEMEILEVGHRQVYNVPAAFDIETSSFKIDEEKAATMYIWQFGLNGSVIYGRTWEEFLDFCDELVGYLGLNSQRRLLIYVHNLGYEFAFMRKWFDWDKVFAIKNRRPVYAIAGGLEFRCSLFLSNYSLAYLGDNLLTTYKVKKLVGNLDYSKIRHSLTPLTDEELAYCINDVRVVMAYIQEKIEQDGDITQIPLTNTGYVRNYCRKECFFQDCETEEEKKKALYSYRALMKSLKIKDKPEYDQLHRAFMGGFTHAGCYYSNQEHPLENIGSADLTSSYPFAMVGQYYPMSPATYIGHIDNAKLFKYYIDRYCCLFDIEIHNLRPKSPYENPLSLSRCNTSGRTITNNGRIVSSEMVRTTLTELDYDTLTKFYQWDSYKIMNLRIYEKGYLPKPFILAILSLYADKTQLKGIAGKETEYLVSKNMINAGFGMMVTAIIRDEYVYDGDWTKNEADTISQLNNYNRNFNRFLFYAWGVWVTAHARHNLFSAIYEFGEDYVYSDTDSIKGFNFSKHMDYFKQYNHGVTLQLLDMCNTYNIPFSMCKPKTKEGIPKEIGLWEIEDSYKLFKTVGAKRYIYMYEDGFVNMTVSGINKKFAMPYMIAKWNDIDLKSDEFRTIKKAYQGDREARKFVISRNYDYEMVFREFGEGLFIPAGHTGKMTLTYIDKPTSGIISDYLGKEVIFHEQTSVHMEPQYYYMSMLDEYTKFLEGVRYVEY